MKIETITIDPVKLGLAISADADIDFLFEGVPGYYETADEQDPIVYKKVKGAVLPWTWYIYEADREEEVFMAFVDGDFPESGTVSLEDLKMAGIEIDYTFKPTPLSEIQDLVMSDFK